MREVLAIGAIGVEKLPNRPHRRQPILWGLAAVGMDRKVVQVIGPDALQQAPQAIERALQAFQAHHLSRSHDLYVVARLRLIRVDGIDEDLE